MSTLVASMVDLALDADAFGTYLASDPKPAPQPAPAPEPDPDEPGEGETFIFVVPA